jgi:hypothetical protein
MNKWKLKARCILAILRGRGVIYGIHFADEVYMCIHPDRREFIVVNCLVTESVSQSLFNTEEILANVDAWAKGEK